MAMTVQQLRGSLRLVPTEAMMAARIPDGPGARSEPLARVGQHNRSDDDISDGQGVEIFTDPAGGKDVPDMSAAALNEALARFPGGVLVRVAVPIPRVGEHDIPHVRILDIETIGFGTAQGDEMPPVELHCERWDGLALIVRRDDHKVGDQLGDVVHSQDYDIDAEGNPVPKGPSRMTVAGPETVGASPEA